MSFFVCCKSKKNTFLKAQISSSQKNDINEVIFKDGKKK